MQSTGANAVGALFVFLDLLEGQAEVTAENLLRHLHLDASHPDAKVNIDRIRGGFE
jgi:hypothetical protein